MSRADGKAERDRIEAERAVREAVAARQTTRLDPARTTSETAEERHRRIAEKTREAFDELDEEESVRKKYGSESSEVSLARRADSPTRASRRDAAPASRSGRDPRPTAQRKTSSSSSYSRSRADSSPQRKGSSAGTRKGNGASRGTGRRSSGSESAVKKKKSPLSVLIIVFFLCVFGFSVYKVADYIITESKTQNAYRTMLGNTKDISGDIPDSSLVDNPLNHESGGDTDTKTEIKVVPVESINIDDIPYISSKYNGSNPDVKGWFYFPGPRSIYGLPINTALLQGSDDYYYLDHDIEGKPDSNGCVYMTSSLDPDLINNPNTIIYGHAKNSKAFAGLKYLNNAKRWYSDANNHFISIRTENYCSVWQIFSWYESVEGGDYDRIATSDWVEYYNYLQSLNKIPSFGKFEFSERDRIITLVTCKGFSNGRVAVHAKLVKYAEINN